MIILKTNQSIYQSINKSVKQLIEQSFEQTFNIYDGNTSQHSSEPSDDESDFGKVKIIMMNGIEHLFWVTFSDTILSLMSFIHKDLGYEVKVYLLNIYEN